jgi:hypothetical protein
MRVDEHRPWMADVERTAHATRKSIEFICREVRGVLLFVSDITALLSEVDRSREYL